MQDNERHPVHSSYKSAPPAGIYRRRPVLVKKKKRRRFRKWFKIFLAVIATLTVLLLIGIIAKVTSKKVKKGGNNNSLTVSMATPAGSVTDVPAANNTETPTPSPTPADSPTPTVYATPVPTRSAEEAGLKLSGGYAIIGDTVWTLYNYEPANGETYAKAVNALRTKLDDTYNIYDIIVPISSDITFPEDLKGLSGASSQKDAIADMYSKIDPSIKTINVYDTLYAHRDEYIYFRTDHHWTSYGAYLAYAEYLKAKGLTAAPKDSYQIKSYPGFLGSSHDILKLQELEDNPDTIEAMIPKSNAVLELTGSDGTKMTWPMISDMSKYEANKKYLGFIGGDYPFAKMKNSKINDGSSCLVVKESYGNTFAPFLTDNYEYVYCVDYRYYCGSFSKLVKELGVKDIILLNNMSATASKKNLGQLYNLLSY